MRAAWIERAQQWRRIRYGRLTNWHRHFALFPVEVAQGEWRWLEAVERKLTWHGGSYGYTIIEAEYRIAPPSTEGDGK